MVKRLSALILGTCLCLGVPRGAEAANLGELAKYLAFIEGFQHLFEFCQAEAKLPDEQVTYARQHIGERRALIFAGLNETQRAKITADAPTMKKQMLDAMDKRTKKDHPGRPRARTSAARRACDASAGPAARHRRSRSSRETRGRLGSRPRAPHGAARRGA